MTGRAECHVWASFVTELVGQRLHRLLLKRGLTSTFDDQHRQEDLIGTGFACLLIGIGCHSFEGDG